MDIAVLEQTLSQAQNRMSRAVKALAAKHQGGEWEEFEAADAELLLLERELAAAKGEEYAVPFDFPVKWDTGAPLPQLLTNDHRTFLIFLIRVTDPNWDGTYVVIKNPTDDVAEPLALVEFRNCESVKLGGPNDEVFEGHPLSGRGLDGYTAQVVQNSRWMAELEAINEVHRGYKGDGWRELKHFVFWFHDSTFECVAESYTVEVFQSTMADLLSEACRRLIA